MSKVEGCYEPKPFSMMFLLSAFDFLSSFSLFLEKNLYFFDALFFENSVIHVHMVVKGMVFEQSHLRFHGTEFRFQCSKDQPGHSAMNHGRSTHRTRFSSDIQRRIVQADSSSVSLPLVGGQGSRHGPWDRATRYTGCDLSRAHDSLSPKQLQQEPPRSGWPLSASFRAILIYFSSSFLSVTFNSGETAIRWNSLTPLDSGRLQI